MARPLRERTEKKFRIEASNRKSIHINTNSLIALFFCYNIQGQGPLAEMKANIDDLKQENKELKMEKDKHLKSKLELKKKVSYLLHGMNQINKVGDKKKKLHVTSEKMKKVIFSASYPLENNRLMTKILRHFIIFPEIHKFWKASCLRKTSSQELCAKKVLTAISSHKLSKLC